MFKRIDHVEIVTDQPERTEAFYTEILGFRSRRATASSGRTARRSTSSISISAARLSS